MMKIMRISVTLLIAVIFAAPLYLATVNVFKENDLIRTDPMALPVPFILDNIDEVLSRPDNLIGQGLQNSIIMTTATLSFVVTLSSPVAFYIARHQNKFTNMLLLFLLFGLMIPPAILLVPVTRLLRTLGLMNSYFGLIAFFIGAYVPFGVFVYTGFIRTIPQELDEAAAIDGASRFRIFWTIIFPLLRPATATVLIFIGLWTWNDFLNPLIILGPQQGQTITTGIYMSLGQYSTDYGQMFATMFLGALPILAFYFALQNEFISGLTGGSIKG